ncbi:MAG: CinA family protein [Oscillospiraceae bacterium]|nr:CinA family protein [Oscillospiraceae bacterium]
MTANVDGINEIIVNRLIESKKTISAAESCTGGLFTALITDVSGASEILEESIVTYSNEAKMRELGVKKSTLDAVGAVSRETARQMAEGIRAHTGADIGVGITGIAGPGGGTPEKPVGTVFVGLAADGKSEVLELHLDGNRERVREQTCRSAFEAVGKLI